MEGRREGGILILYMGKINSENFKICSDPTARNCNSQTQVQLFLFQMTALFSYIMRASVAIFPSALFAHGHEYTLKDKSRRIILCLTTRQDFFFSLSTK
jgi:hypothetical protein